MRHLPGRKRKSPKHRALKTRVGGVVVKRNEKRSRARRKAILGLD